MPVNTPHKSYEATVPQWQRCRDTFDGSDAVKARRETYLPMLDGHADKPEKYTAYLLRALFYNSMARTIGGLCGAVFRKDAHVDIPPIIEPNLTDITLSRTPFQSFALGALQETIKVGRYGVLVEFSDTKNRPYWVPFIAESIVNWRTISVGGEAVLTRVVLKECAEEQDDKDAFATVDVEQYRVLELVVGTDEAAVLVTPETMRSARYRVTVYRKDKDKAVNALDAYVAGKPTFPLRHGESLPFIPFVFFGTSALTASVQRPPLVDLADVNLSHYRSSADLEHGRHFTALPTPYASGVEPGTKLSIGSGAAWCLKDPQARAGYLEFTGQGLEALEKALAEKEAKMATLGARLLEAPSGQAETATAIQMRHAGEHASLKTIATTVQMALELLLRIHAWWMSAIAAVDASDKAVEVELNDEFFAITMTADEMKTQMLMWQSGGISFETFYFNMTRGGVTRPGVDAEAERQAIDAEQPSDPNPQPEPQPEPSPQPQPAAA